MRLSLRSEYALLVLIHITRNQGSSPIDQLSSCQQIPTESLVEILSVLEQSELVSRSFQGYKQTRKTGSTSVVDIIRLFDGALAPLEPVSSKGYAPAPMDSEEKLSYLFDALQAKVITQLEHTTIADLV